ncbi:hypothetical protein KM192_00900 [Pediococcus pentosaceus]|uniref:hypothetical protein n=1 Tax=Pediococcus pentosaceus TaxID=1255 RepID=UPI001C92C6D6|nr:hypothetical protein [Pediococcus pentosaceus]MBY4581298.1 hypothetical protein [Pediococcus pentosaceus]MCI2960301.1 hypothetical protein [Pediococcus pentosaceus]
MHKNEDFKIDDKVRVYYNGGYVTAIVIDDSKKHSAEVRIIGDHITLTVPNDDLLNYYEK